MTNIVILVHDRPRLTQQTLDTLVKNTSGQYNVMIVDDGSQLETGLILSEFLKKHDNFKMVRMRDGGIVGEARNAGANSSEWTFGRGDWLYFSDNDVAYEPQWLEKMIDALQWGETAGTKVIGGYRHPFHGVNQLQRAIYGIPGSPSSGPERTVELTDAVAGYSMLMRWDTFDKFGPFDANQKGVGASEDFAFCQRIIKDGGKVGYIHPPVLSHCGITNSDGKPAVGAEHFRIVPGVLYL